MNDPYRIEVFGGLRVQRSTSITLKFRTRRVALLLARLAYSGRMESRESLIEWLWPDCDLETGRNRLSVTLSSLRRALDEAGVRSMVQANHAEVGLVAGAFVTDVAEFESALKIALTNQDTISPSEESRFLSRAVGLYAGELLAEFSDDWIIRERKRLSEQFFYAVCRLEELGVLPLATIGAHLQRALSYDTTREDVVRALMRSYTGRGQTTHALRCYLDLEDALRTEGGVKPAAETRQLRERLAASYPRSGHSDEPASHSITDSRLPLPHNRFFGREAELRALTTWAFAPIHDGDALADSLSGRLVTLIGGGGNGKTRLALEVARSGFEWQEGNVYFVPLLDTLRSNGIANAILRAIGVSRSSTSDPLAAASEVLNRRPSLVILDNFEHLVDDGAALLQSLLKATPRTRYLVTTQRRLGIAEESEFSITSLSTSSLGEAIELNDAAAAMEHIATNQAVQLFVSRAQMVRSNFQLRAENVSAVAQVCQALEGVPLALELAASRARALSPQQMLVSLKTRLRFLERLWAGDGEALLNPRHRSLRAALDWSYALLPLEVQRCFRRLSVFQGGWTLEDAQAVCAPSEESLAEESEFRAHEIHEILCEYSLLETREQGGMLRFRFLEAVREYAAERSEQEEDAVARRALRQRHASHFVQVAESAAQPLRNTQDSIWIVRLAADQPNLRAALHWALEHEPINALRLCAVLWWFWFLHSDLTEGRGWLVQALQRFEDSSALNPHPSAEPDTLRWHAEALSGAGFLAWRQGDFAQAGALGVRGLEMSRVAEDGRATAYSIIVVLMTRLLSNDFTTIQTLGAECLQLCRDMGDQVGQGFSLHILATAAEHEGDLPLALSLHEQSVALFRVLDSQDGMAYTLLNLGNAWRRSGNPQRALTALDESLNLFRALFSREGETYAALYRAMALAEAGEVRDAAQLYRESLPVFSSLGLQWGWVQCLEGLAFLEGALLEDRTHEDSRLMHAVRLWSAAQAVREVIGAQVPPVDVTRFNRFVLGLRQRMDAPCFEAAWQTGRALTREQILHDALTA